MRNYRTWTLISIAAAALLPTLIMGLRPSLEAGAQTGATATASETSVATATPVSTTAGTATPDATAISTTVATATPISTTAATTEPGATAAATSAPSATPTATPSPIAAASEDEQPGSTFNEEFPGGGGHNIVNAVNRVDNRLLVRGSVKLVHIPGPSAAPVNEALAFASCSGCQTFSLALEIALISKDATSIAPENFASAINYKCTNCVTVARALQYVIQVDDPNKVPDDARMLVDQMQDQLQGVSHDPSVTQADQAEAVINNVIAQFTQLSQNLSDQRQEETEPDTPGGG